MGVPFDRFTNIKQIGEGGFAKVYSAIWMDGKANYIKQINGSLKILDSELMRVALKRLNGSQNMSAEYLNEVYFVLLFEITYLKYLLNFYYKL